MYKILNHGFGCKKIGFRQFVALGLMMLLAAGMCVTAPKSVEAASKLQFTKSVDELTAGQSYQFKVNQKDVVWSVGNEKIAEISLKGKVTAKRYGRTRVYAEYNGKKKSVPLLVKGKKIVGIDAGHQKSGNSATEPNGPGSKIYKAKVAGGTRGTTSGVPEYQMTLDVALKLKEELLDRGYQVVLTRPKNEVNISNKERAVKINESGADICLRLHGDGVDSSSASGASMQCHTSKNPYISDLYKASNKLSKCILDAYCKSTGLKNRGIAYRDDLTGTNWSTVPVTLIELGFMTNPSDDRFITSADGQAKMVQGLADGIDAYFGY